MGKNSDLRRKRTNIDYSKHKLEVFKSEGLLVHYLKLPDSYTNSVKFINTNGIMAVTGDFGNWIFCREFHPTADGYVSGGYWDEKLHNSSTQKSDEFDEDTAKEQISEMLKENEYSDEIKEWLNDLSDAASEGEYAYIAKIMDRPDFDAEDCPEGRKRHIWLSYIYDAFDEICKRFENMDSYECKDANDLKKCDQ